MSIASFHCAHAIACGRGMFDVEACKCECERCEIITAVARRRAQQVSGLSPQFAGQRGTVLHETIVPGGDHGHAISVVEYCFRDTTVPYLEISEPGRKSQARIISIDTAVHALLNLGEMEIFIVGNRDVETPEGA